MTWDLPTEPDKLQVYANKARADWIPTTLSYEGAIDVATYRNPLESSPQVSGARRGNLRGHGGLAALRRFTR